MMMTKFLRRLCGVFGPSGCEDAVAAEIRREGEAFGFFAKTDRTGNVIFEIEPKTAMAETKTVMISTHTDEVGFMVNEIDEEGYLHFSLLGDIDPRVLCGRNVEIGNEEKRVMGVIASKAIHHQTAEERSKITEVENMYIDIGAENGEDAKKTVSVGDYGTFFMPLPHRFGQDNRYVFGKAMDNRAACAVALDVMRQISEGAITSPHKLCFCFTVRGVAGPCGAGLAAATLCPDVAIVMDAAEADIAEKEAVDLAALDKGCVLTFADDKTVYDVSLVRLAQAVAEKAGVLHQVKGKMGGGRDAAEIQKRYAGVPTVSLRVPTRYCRTASSVVSETDCKSAAALLGALLASPLK